MILQLVLLSLGTGFVLGTHRGAGFLCLVQNGLGIGFRIGNDLAGYFFNSGHAMSFLPSDFVRHSMSCVYALKGEKNTSRRVISREKMA